MTTAARPTFEPARGGRGKGEGDLSALSKQYSSRDLPGHTKLKYRQAGQDTSDEVNRRDLRKDLTDRERNARDKRSDRSSNRDSSSAKRPRVEQIPVANLDADEAVEERDEDDDSSDDSDDDAAELLAELNKIKKERAREQAAKVPGSGPSRAPSLRGVLETSRFESTGDYLDPNYTVHNSSPEEMEKKQEEERIRTENIFSGNPLMHGQSKTDFKVKKRWDDDVVFKNCAKGEEDKPEKRFINDTLRSEFHKRFLEKYIK